jgi:hypothetical protein
MLRLQKRVAFHQRHVDIPLSKDFGFALEALLQLLLQEGKDKLDHKDS